MYFFVISIICCFFLPTLEEIGFYAPFPRNLSISIFFLPNSRELYALVQMFSPQVFFFSGRGVCVCVFSSHSFWTSSSLDVPAGATQEEGHT